MSTVNLSKHEKEIQIARACDAADLDRLVRLAESDGGLLNDSLRCRAWPVLLGYSKLEQRASDPAWKRLPEHRDEGQVRLDVDRAFSHYPKLESDKAKGVRKEQLFELIVSVIRQHPDLCYSQGYHDIAQVLLLVLGQDAARTALTYLSLLRIRDYMLPTLAPAVKHIQLLPAIFKQADPPLAAHLSRTNPYFAISATLTLNAHDIEDYGDIVRIFDFILAHEPVMALYFIAAMVISRRKVLLEIDELDMLHYQLTKLPKPLDLENYIEQAIHLFDYHPPDRLPGFVWRRLPSSSVLKTSRPISKQQTLGEAEELFRLQVKQLEKERKRQELQKRASQLLRKNKRPLISISAALVCGCFAIWLRRTGNDQMMMSFLTSLTRVSWKAGL